VSGQLHQIRISVTQGAVRPLGLLGLSPTLFLEKKKKGEWIFEKQFVHCIYNLLKERR
jgi:hypothetical protein